jgi:hypothetical protein
MRVLTAVHELLFSTHWQSWNRISIQFERDIKNR